MFASGRETSRISGNGGRHFQMSSSGRETLPDVQEWWEAFPNVQQWSGDLPDVRE